MSHSVSIHKDAVAPYALQPTISGGGIDYSTVTGGRLEVSPRGSSTVVTWTCSIVAQSATSVTIQRIFQSGDVSVAGVFTVVAWLDRAAGDVRSQPFTLFVES